MNRRISFAIFSPDSQRIVTGSIGSEHSKCGMQPAARKLFEIKGGEFD